MAAAAGGARRGAFISYARADGQDAARALHERLAAEAPDVPAWLDRHEIEGGIGWWAQIEAALDRAEFLIVVMTPAALRSPHTRQEWRAARQRGVCVYPVMGVPAAALDFGELPPWMRKRHCYDPQHEWPTLLAHLRRGCEATRLPFMAPPLPPHLVPRPREMEAALALLLQPGGEPVAITTALRGAGGFGKTTLAAAICHHDRVIEHFDDGILWVTLGTAPNLLNELIKLHAALTGERPGFVDVDDAAHELAQKLEHRHCLLVIDNAWSAAQLRPFLRAAAGRCACLITTRLFEVAQDAHRIDVDRMTAGEGLALLQARLGGDAAASVGGEALRALVARLGEWPLPIKLAASAMRQRIARGEAPAAALGYVQRALDKRGPTAFDLTDEAVGATLDASLGMLDEAARARCAELSVFAPQEPVPLASAAALWARRGGLDAFDSEELARRLDDLALVDFDLQRGVLRLHDVVRGVLAHRLGDAAPVHAALLEAWGDPLRLPSAHAWRNLGRHLLAAGRADALRALLLDARWLEAKLAATHVHALLGDFAAVEDRVLQLLQGALRLSAPALAADPAQLGLQLCARLLGRAEPALQALCAAFGGGGPWRLVHATLDGPGGPLTMTLAGHEREVSALAWDAGGTRLVSASRDASVRLWDLRDGQWLATLDGHGLGARAVACDGAAAMALVGGGDGRLYLWDLAAPPAAVRFAAEAQRAFAALACSADGRLAVSAGREHHLRVWDLAQRRCVALLIGHEEEVNAVALSADGRRLLSGGTDRLLRLWDAAQDAPLRTIATDGGTITAVALAAGGQRALSGSADRYVRLWDLRDGRLLARLEGHSDTVRALLVDDAGERAVSAGADRMVKLWRLDELQPPQAPPSHNASVVALVFSADGRWCASGSAEGSLQVLEVASGRLVQSMRAGTLPVRSLAFSPDGSVLLSGSLDGSYLQWTIADGSA